jgi:2-polyprenyl-3-methyl-5-hydroxy-6-metoxy-1,4-benzoquinol methylase
MGHDNANYFANRRADMLDFVPIDVRHVLEIGCGAGGFARGLRERNASIELWGVEPSPAADQASGVMDRVLKGTVEHYMDALPEGYFDAICMNDVIEHLLDPWSALRALRSKLAPRGVLVASIPNVRHYRNLESLLLDGEWMYRDEGTLDRTHLRFFTPKSMRRLFDECGYEIEHMQGIRRSRKLRLKLWNLLFAGRLWDAFYLQFAIVARPSVG